MALRTASTLSEDLLLEYTNGMRGKDLGWGRLNSANLRQILELHTGYSELARRTPYVARARRSNLLQHILDSLRQAALGKPVPGALGAPTDAALVITGHDTNPSNVSGMFGVSWLLPGYQRNDPVPGGALGFELWRTPQQKTYSVRAYYTAQTLEQMRDARPVTMAAPPPRAPVFIPGCGSASDSFDCSWEDFERALSSAIDLSFARP